MQIIKDTTNFQIEGECAAAVGKFDGIHRGHLLLLSHILEQKKKGRKAAVFTFDPPAGVFFGKAKEGELTTLEEKRDFFERIGIDILIEFPLNERTAAITAEDFIRQILAGQMRTAYIAAGDDVSFGYRGEGDRKLLESLAPECGCEVQIISKVYCGEREISSSCVREEVEAGRMEQAGKLLGRSYSISGKVEPGKKLGRRLGMPTLNLYPPENKLLPPAGVYYSRVRFRGRSCEGITNIGRKPTVNDTAAVSVETYLYGYEGNLYGEKITVELLHFRRPERKFRDVEELRSQMEKDILAGREYHAIETAGNCFNLNLTKK